MTIEQSKIIDFVSLGDDTNEVILTIVDHLAWDQDEQEHLLLLQEKLNSYLQFVEDGELYQHYPQAKGRDVVISLAAKFALSKQANDFFELAGRAIAELGFRLQLDYPEAN